MTRGISIVRRQFLRIAGTTLAAAGLGLMLTGEASAHEKALGQRILALLHDPESAGVIGKAYLQLRPQEADFGLLAASLVGNQDIRGSHGSLTGRAALNSAFQVAHRLDFEKNELVVIGGWFLTRSEARLCALAHLLRHS